MKQSAYKELLLNRFDTNYTTYEYVPSYLHSLLIPHAKCFTDIDDNGIVVDQQIEMEDLSIYYHLIHLKEGVQLNTIPAHKYYLPAHVSGFMEDNAATPLRVTLRKQEVNSLNNSPEADTMITEKEFVISFHVNFCTYSLRPLALEFPAFRIISEIGVEEARKPSNKLPFRLNEVNYQVMNRICSCKHIGKIADIFFRRNAVDFYLTYLHYLKNVSPVMLKDTHQQQLREIVAFIIGQPLEADSKEALCDRFNVVPEFLETPFEQEFLINVEDLILQEKMAQIFKLITETNHTLTYIATLTKYSSWEELTKAFEKYYKCNIADLRKAQ